MTLLIICRHGNTFGPEDTPTRVGARTDLPLVEKGFGQARAIGRWLKDKQIYPEAVYCSPLQRTRQTAETALKEAGYKEPVYALDIFTEIDYGPDENKTEEDVIARIGEEAIENWNKNGTVPNGWKVNPEDIIRNWVDFADHIVRDEQDCVMVVTSNGIARFAPHITGDFDNFSAAHDIKLSTGGVCVFAHDGQNWRVQEWNLRPK